MRLSPPITICVASLLGAANRIAKHCFHSIALFRGSDIVARYLWPAIGEADSREISHLSA